MQYFFCYKSNMIVCDEKSTSTLFHTAHTAPLEFFFVSKKLKRNIKFPMIFFSHFFILCIIQSFSINKWTFIFYYYYHRFFWQKKELNLNGFCMFSLQIGVNQTKKLAERLGRMRSYRTHTKKITKKFNKILSMQTEQIWILLPFRLVVWHTQVLRTKYGGRTQATIAFVLLLVTLS